MIKSLKNIIIPILKKYKNDKDFKNSVKIIENIKNKKSLSESDFIEISKWKLLSQIGRVKKRLENNTSLISLVTRHVFDINEKLTKQNINQEKIDKISVKSLMTLDGVGLGVASAILALKYPARYAVIDFRTWDILSEFNFLPKSNKSGQRTFSLKEYFLYLEKVRNIAKRLKIEPQKVDWALWKYYDLRKKGFVK